MLNRSGQHPDAVAAGKAKHQQPSQVDRGDPQRPPPIVAPDPPIGHPPAAVSDQPGQRAFHHRPPPPIALLETPSHRLAAGGAQLVLVPMQADDAATVGGGAATAQRTASAPAGEADPAGAGDRRDLARRAPGRAGLGVDAEVVEGEPTRHRALERDRLDRLEVAGSPKRRPGRPGAVGESPSTSNPGSSPASSWRPVGPSGRLAAVSAHSVTSPVSGSAAMWPL